MPWPTPMHMVASASLPPVRCSSSVAVSANRAHPEGMAEGNCTTVGVHIGRVVGKPELAEHSQRLRGKGLVQLDHVEVADLDAEALHQLLRRRRRADAHDPRRHAGDGGAQNARARCQAVALRRLFAGDNDCRGAIIDSGCIAGGDRSVLANYRLQRCKFLERRRARMLVLADDYRVALALRNFDRDNFGGEAAIGLRFGGALLAA